MSNLAARRTFTTLVGAIFVCKFAFGCAAPATAIEVVTTAVEPSYVPSPGSGLSLFGTSRNESLVLILGTRHTFDEANPQFPELERLFRLFRPTVVLVEGGKWAKATTKEETIRISGEMGFVTYLAEEFGVSARSMEPRFEDEVAYALSAYGPVDVKLYYSLRMVSQFQQQKATIGVTDRMNSLLGGNELEALCRR